MKILIVDDSLLLRMLYESYFNLTKHRAESADQFAAMDIDWGAYDAVLLDVMMPQIQGYELLRAVKSKWSTKPVIVVFSVLSPRVARAAFADAGVAEFVDGYIPKSGDLIDSMRRLEALIGNASSGTGVESQQFA